MASLNIFLVSLILFDWFCSLAFHVNKNRFGFLNLGLRVLHLFPVTLFLLFPSVPQKLFLSLQSSLIFAAKFQGLSRTCQLRERGGVKCDVLHALVSCKEVYHFLQLTQWRKVSKMLLIPRSDQSLQPGPPTLAGDWVTARHLEIRTRLYFPWAELSSLPAPSSLGVYIDGK